VVSGAREPHRPWRETAAIPLTAKKYFQIATVYEKAAADTMTVPRQQRAAFTRKARWFHMLARIKAAKEAGGVLNDSKALGRDDDALDRHTMPSAVWALRPGIVRVNWLEPPGEDP